MTEHLDGRPPERSRGRLAQRLALAAPAVVLVAAAVVLGLQVRADDFAQQVRTAATDAAEDEAVAVTGVSALDVEGGLARVLTGATGNFRAAYEQQAATLRITLREQDVRSSAQVLDSGVIQAGGRSAVVIVVVQATVSNRAQPTTSPHRYRLQLRVDKVGDTWLTSSFEMLP